MSFYDLYVMSKYLLVSTRIILIHGAFYDLYVMSKYLLPLVLVSFSYMELSMTFHSYGPFYDLYVMSKYHRIILIHDLSMTFMS